MDAMLRPSRMDTTLPVLMSMPILDPMSMPTHLGIMSPISTPIEEQTAARRITYTILSIYASRLAGVPHRYTTVSVIVP